MSEQDFFTKQVLTYMGNKRKYLTKIDEIIKLVKAELEEENISIGEGFSGSGIVSRLFKNRATENYSEEIKPLYVNDISEYSKILNECYLTSTKNLSTDDIEQLILHIKQIREFILKPTVEPLISKQ